VSIKEYFIVDTIDATGNIINLKWLESEYCPILYIGNLTDTIIIDHLLHFAPIPPPPDWDFFAAKSNSISQEENIESIKYQKDLAEYKTEVEAYPLTKYLFSFDSVQNLGSIYRDKVQIKVDTNFTISKMVGFDFKTHHGDFFEAYPIIITNSGNDTMLIGYHRHLNLSVEAKDSIGNWSKILDSHNIHGLPLKESYMLLPGLSVITSTFKTTGEYNTKLRIRIGNSTSDEWTGNIDYNQFNSKFNERGEYKFEYLEYQKKTLTTTR